MSLHKKERSHVYTPVIVYNVCVVLCLDVKKLLSSFVTVIETQLSSMKALPDKVSTATRASHISSRYIVTVMLFCRTQTFR